MDPLVARGFVTVLLTPTRIAQLKQFENTLPPGRYLQAVEVLQSYSLVGGEITEERESNMKRHLEIWQKQNWLKTQIEDKDHAIKCAQIKPGSKWCNCRTYQQEIHEWMDYIGKNWIEPLPTAKRRTTDKFGVSDPEEVGTSGYSKKATTRYQQPDMGDMP